MENSREQYSFNISLSVLEHLGRGLYRNFITVLGEAISNSWDADAKNVWIYINEENKNFTIKDDGIGMDDDDFRNKFLKIGYSKRKKGENKSPGNRVYIGRKGIGKLALLSCSNKISILAKKQNSDYVGGVIDNAGLDKAIKSDMSPDEYLLKLINPDMLAEHTAGHEQGTIIHFEQFKDGLNNSESFLRKAIALYFRFSLLDENFKIFLNNKEITIDDIKDLFRDTEFLWTINDLDDHYIETLRNDVKKEAKLLGIDNAIKGFLATTIKPRMLSIFGTGEKIGVDLYVNGRLRETNILKHRSGYSTRHIASYLYGQIHYDELDDDEDRFTTSREGLKPGDEKFDELLKQLDSILQQISEKWDAWRKEEKESVDPDLSGNDSKEQKSRELFSAVSREYTPTKEPNKKKGLNKKVDGWVNNLGKDAEFNFSSYAECFISENLIRNYIDDQKIKFSTESKRDIDAFKNREEDSKKKSGISIKIREKDDDSSYLAMDGLANLVDKNPTGPSLSNDAKEYKPMRDAVAHTALLTKEAKKKLTSVYDNIKERLNVLLSQI